MKENFDPHQVVISREYFNTLITMAGINDVPAGRKNHPNQTIIGRILWHARKFNRALHNERQVDVEKDLLIKRHQRHKRTQLIKEYGNGTKQVFVMDGENDWPTVICGESRKSKMHIRCMVIRAHTCNFEAVHVDSIIRIPRAFK